MKRFVTCLALVILTIAAGTMGVVRGAMSTQQLAPTATPPVRPDATDKRLDWAPLGGPYERVVYALAFAPTARTLYAGTWGHSVYSSWDGGQSWYPNGPDRPPYVKALAVLPSSDRFVYAGTYSQGLRWSTDGGWSWGQLGSYSGFTGPVDPAHPDRNHFHVESLLIYSDQGTERMLAGTRNGIWSSGALSDTWTQLNSGFADTDAAYNIRALARDPAGGLYAGTVGGLYGSQDGGQTWRYMGPPDDYPDEAHQIMSLAVVTDSVNPSGTLLIGTDGAGVCALEVGGRSWYTRTEGLPDDERARRIQALLSTPDGTAYAGTVDYGVYELKPGGEEWEQRADGLPSNSRSILSFALDPAGDILYAGTYGDGVYRWDAGNERWEPAKGETEKTKLPVDFPVQRIAFAGSDGERLLAGLQVGGMYSTTCQQETVLPWQRLPEALPIGPARDVAGLVVGGPDRLTVVAAAGTGIRRSLNAGADWVQLGSAQNLPDGDVKGQALVQGRDNADILYAALADEVGVYRSDDAGDNWRPASGDLDPALRNQICCLATGADDDTVYLGLRLGQVYTRQVYVTHDTGTTWEPLSRISDEGSHELQGLDWNGRSAWDVFLHGGERQMLYARTEGGIYVSYDDGRSWQRRMRGFFSALWADPYHPWMVYVASPDTTLDREFASPIELTSDLWVSEDGGETWTWTGPGPSLSPEESSASITALALDPNDETMLYAGTEGAGVFRADLQPIMRSRTYTPAAIALLVSSILLLGGVGYVVQTGLSLGRRCGLPPRAWLGLAYLRATHADDIGLVGDAHTPLKSLERLVLALAPGDPFRPEVIREQLEASGIPILLSQVEVALDSLARDYRLLSRSAEGYRLIHPMIGRLARGRFWNALTEREGLAEEVRGESQLRADTRHFFTQAGFDPFPFGVGFRVASSLPKYALLGGDQGIYVHLHTGTVVDEAHIEQVADNARPAYEQQPAGPVAFLVVSGPPRVEAYQRILRLWQEENLRIVLLSHNGVRRAITATTSQRQLDRALQRTLGDRDLFRHDGPVLDLLDFFGREAALQEIVAGCQQGQAIGLGGMAKVGKTSLARQTIDRLPQAVVAWLDAAGPYPNGFYPAVRQAWLADAQLRFPHWELPHLEPLPEQPTPAQIADDLAILSASLRSQVPTGLLTAVLDGLGDSEAAAEELETLAQASATTEGVSLLAIFESGLQRVTGFQKLLLQPFREATAARMIDSLAIQMEAGFEPEATGRLYVASGGHPLLLRQLASLVVAQENGTDGRIAAIDVEEAISQRAPWLDSTFDHLWSSLGEEQQRVLLSATGRGSLPANDELAQLEESGWLCQDDGRWRLFSQALDRWLSARFPSQE